MWTIIGFVILGITLAFIGHLEVSISPFYVKMPAWRMAFGLFSIGMGILFIIMDADRRAIEKVHQELNDELRKLKSETLRES